MSGASVSAVMLAGAIGIALDAYALFGGADFGGGVWDLFATGPRRTAQRELIAHTIAPIWEANHVWLILVVVMLFTGFPPAFAALSTVLHVPLTIMLIGIVLRGSAFIFRSYDVRESRARWGPLFAVSSLITPVLLGACVGALASGRVGTAVRALESGERGFVALFVSSWLAPFPIAVGLMTLALFAFLAATYLTIDAKHDRALQEDFRARALMAAVAVFVTAVGALLLSSREPTKMNESLLRSAWALPFQVATGAAAITAIVALVARRYALARVAAVAQASLILWGWLASQFPSVIPGAFDLSSAAAPASTLHAALWALAIGAVVLFPSLWYLLAIFRSKTA